jgi:hypothetical protein
VTAIEKTEKLVRKRIPLDLIDPTPDNPNEMSEAEFNMLADNIETVGLVDPLFVRELPNGRYRLIGGNHRCEVLKVLGFDEAECTINNDPEFDEDQEKFQVLRMNVIRGKLSPEKFMKMYQSMSQKYADEVLAESFGFANEDDFRKLIGQVKSSLPQEMQSDFQQAAKEIKTIDDLSKLLNHLFTTYGDTLPYGYMLLDFGGKDSIWLRMSNETKKAVLEVGKLCVTEKRSMDAILGGVVQMVAQGKLSPQVLQLIAQTPPVEIPSGVNLPTEELLASSLAQ